MKLFRICLLLGSAAAWLPVHAGTIDTLSSVLERIRIQEPSHFSYRETRYLQLLVEPWQAAGGLTLGEKANQRLQQILAEHEPTPLPPEVMAELDELEARWWKETRR